MSYICIHMCLLTLASMPTVGCQALVVSTSEKAPPIYIYIYIQPRTINTTTELKKISITYTNAVKRENRTSN